MPKIENARRIVLAIGGSDTSGGAGIQADIKALASIGVHGATAITAVTDQTTKTVYGAKRLSLEFIESQISHVIEDLQPSAIKTGMLYDTATIQIVGEKIKDSGIPAVVDPVMVATVGKELIKGEYQFNIILKESLDVRYKPFVAALKKYLLPYATIVTPNLNEASHLVGWKLRTIEDVKLACKTLADTGCKFILIKGGHLESEKGKAIDVLYDSKSKKYYEYEYPRIRAKFHGSGCTYASLIAGFMALGYDVPEAVGKAKAKLWEMMSRHYALGPLDVADHIGAKPQEAKGNREQRQAIAEVEWAICQAETILTPALTPEVGINIGYALPDPIDREDICALEGRIVRVGQGVGHLGIVKFGASKHIANIILAAADADPQMRSAMNIKYHPDLVEKFKGILTVSSFDRAKEPEGVSSMEWGTAEAIRKLRKVPDIVWDAGGMGKEPMIRILGRNPREVIEKLRKIASL